ncbi:SHOCT domain-containing protein [Halorhabdus rudnickae]|uniref:SHOCT domain-containing protein n=1 Tax=Halorhabdus rudnickae TaxID=1775544 RepID=UPI001083E993|nr:SHOCT domain-containing protein [Halorhabdus rudnickae]
MLKTTGLVDNGWTSRAGSVRPRSNEDTNGRRRGTVSRVARTGLFVVTLLVATGSANAQHGSGGMMGSGGYGAFGMSGFGLVFWLVLALGIVGLVAYARGGSRSRPETSAGTDTRREKRDRALETLREQYARGELEAEEFERRRAELERS